MVEKADKFDTGKPNENAKSTASLGAGPLGIDKKIALIFSPT